MAKNQDDLRTVEELKTNPYPQNVQVACYGGKIIGEDDDDDDDEDDEEQEKDDNGVVHMKADRSFRAGGSDMDDPDKLLVCTIQSYDETTMKYTVHLSYDGVYYVISDFPKRSIRLVLKPYTSDIHIKGAFRHFMEIDDDIFPEHWKTSEED
mmetsp:Transcript_600/g.758  ORF Transcript_600/g.758 Transcript_600/m.758 type:complete len:152 (+) Transcript_600:1166-1621(+)